MYEDKVVKTKKITKKCPNFAKIVVDLSKEIKL